MKCKQCQAEYTPKRSTSQYCSAKCRVQSGRVSVTTEPEVSVTKVSVTDPYEVLPDAKCYGRQAVKYPGTSKWPSRPEPYNPTDIPCPNNRCIYNTIDGDRYIIDACGGKIDKVNGSWGV